MTRRLFFFSAAAASSAAARSWEQPAFPNWTPEFLDKMLTDSPWARAITVPFVFQPQPQSDPLRSDFSQIQIPGGVGIPTRIPGTGWPGGTSTGRGTGYPTGRVPNSGGRTPGVRTEMYLTVRWSSALPIRQALALQQFGREGLEDPLAVELITKAERDCVVEVAGFRLSMVPQGAAALEKELKKSAKLAVKGRRSVFPSSVQVPEHGMHLMATLRFPRFEDIGADDGVLQFSAEAGPAKIECPFKLKPMVYRGRLEL
ncbi:MAG: hypothetical protein ABIZ80_09140 [Bryobacteraceae bacterium]